MKHINVVAGIICYNDEILCMQRPESKYEYTSLKFEFPGGKIEPGENNIEALKRELVEEMDMHVESEEKDFFLTVNHQYPDFEITMHSYICKVKSKEFTLKEHKSYKWLNKDELSQLDWAMADVPIMEKLLRG